MSKRELKAIDELITVANSGCAAKKPGNWLILAISVRHLQAETWVN